jgi:hypothetical protein
VIARRASGKGRAPAPLALASLALAAACSSPSPAPSGERDASIRQRVAIEVHADVPVSFVRWTLRHPASREAYSGNTRGPLAPGGEPLAIVLDVLGDGPWTLLLTDDIGRTTATARCYDLAAGDTIRDRVLLVPVSLIDRDADGVPAALSPSCVDVEGPCDHPCPPAIAAIDCDDTRPDVSPSGFESCADDIDQDCDGADAECGDQDGDGVRACGPLMAPVLPLTCDCSDFDHGVAPGLAEVCGDGIDQDCDFVDAACDRDGDGVGADIAIGGRPDCDDGDPTVHPGAAEVDCDRDRNCNGALFEGPGCIPDDLDGDGYPACAAVPTSGCDCHDCDPGVHPGAADRCADGVDADCDGGDPACPLDDRDGDGALAPADCDDLDPTRAPGAPERCGDGVAQGCVADARCIDDADADGWIETGACASDPSLTPWQDEICDGRDQGCDDRIDHVLAPPAVAGTRVLPRGIEGCVVDDPRTLCGGGTPCRVDFRSSLHHCGGCRMACNEPGAPPRADGCSAGRCTCGASAACAGSLVCCGGVCAPPASC